MGKVLSFADLKEKDTSELSRITRAKRDELVKKEEEKAQLIGRILWLQDCIAKV